MRILALTIGLLTGCSSAKPGDYLVYRIGYGTTEVGDSCYGDTGGTPIDVIGDSSTFRTGATFAILPTGKDTAVADLDGQMIPGTKTKEGYAFEGETIDAEFFGDGDRNSTTTTTNVKLDIVADGRSISGTSVTQQTVVCAGTECTDAGSECRQSTEFIGALVDGVELEHPL